jgi:hypothetical protein
LFLSNTAVDIVGLTSFLGAHAHPRTGAPENATITPQMMMQYLMATLAGRGDAVNNLSAMGWGPPDMHQGRMGDYVFNQEGNLLADGTTDAMTDAACRSA